MEIYEIETFLMIANTRSISKAAQKNVFISISGYPSSAIPGKGVGHGFV